MPRLMDVEPRPEIGHFVTWISAEVKEGAGVRRVPFTTPGAELLIATGRYRGTHGGSHFIRVEDSNYGLAVNEEIARYAELDDYIGQAQRPEIEGIGMRERFAFTEYGTLWFNPVKP